MISRLLKFIYKNTPKPIGKALGRSHFLQPVRDFLLRKGNSKRLLTVKARWGDQSFYYTGDFKSAIKAERRGIENSLLRLSIKLIKEVKQKEHTATVFDVGTSYGYLSTVWALTVCVRGKVYGFEANPVVYKTAFNTALKNSLDDRILYNHCAVFNKEGVISMDMHDGTHASLSDAGKGEHLAQVRAITLDAFCNANNIQHVDLIKIDVDGPEWEVLEGAASIIERVKPILIVESNGDRRIMSWLHGKGYAIYDLYMNKIQVGSIPPPNIVAVSNNPL